MLYRSLFLSAIVCVGLLGCAPRPTATPEATPTTMSNAYEVLAQERFGKAFEATPNADSAYVLVTAKASTTPQDPFPTLRMFIFDVAKGSVIFEDTVAKGNASWQSSHEVEVTSVPGIVQGNEQGDRLNGYVFDVRYGRKRARSATNR